VIAPVKYLVGISAVIIAVFSSLGFYLVRGTPVSKELVASGHNHILSFAYGAILFALLLKKLDVSNTVKWILAVWMTLSFLGPLDLIYAGFTGDRAYLSFTSPAFNGSFVVLWLAMAYFVVTSKDKKE